jgi:membrane complex biogenesis BtpA family protein
MEASTRTRPGTADELHYEGVQTIQREGAMTSLFSRSKPVVGVIHVGALPGTPRSSQSVAELMVAAREEAKLYRECGVDGVIIENMHDVPYLRSEVGPEIVAAMTAIGVEVKSECRLPVGVQILAGANIEAMAVAHAAGLDFIRAEGYAYAHVADEGLIQASAAKLLRYKRMIGAERIQVWTDVKKKHSAHAITADVSLGETAETVEFMGADCVIVTGSVTGQAPKVTDVQEAKAHCSLPVFLGSGISEGNIIEFYEYADGFIIGSAFKVNGFWSNTIDPTRVTKCMDLLNQLRNRD